MRRQTKLAVCIGRCGQVERTFDLLGLISQAVARQQEHGYEKSNVGAVAQRQPDSESGASLSGGDHANIVEPVLLPSMHFHVAGARIGKSSLSGLSRRRAGLFTSQRSRRREDV